MLMTHKTHLISRKSLMIKSKGRKCYMYLKFHRNPPYMAEVKNFILNTHFLFSVSIYSITVILDIDFHATKMSENMSYT